MSTKKKQNPFEYNESAEFIACVGINGGYGDSVIRDGFRDAAIILMKEVIKSSYEDQYVYPIIYCARHSVELSLKIYIRMLLALYEIKDDKVERPINKSDIIKKIHTHNIQELNDIIVAYYEIDKRLSNSYDPLIQDLKDYAIDPEGDLFKYEYSLTETSHMVDKNITSISLDIFITQFDLLCKKIDRAIDSLWALLQEYKHHTFTKHLSRKAIYEIACDLPQKSTWSNTSFDLIKNDLISKYNISSKELSNIITMIQNHREFCTEIGEEIIFGNLSKSTLELYNILMEDLKKYNNNRDSLSITEMKSLSDDRGFTTNIIKIASTLPTHELVLLVSFMEIGKPGVYSEELDDIYQSITNAGMTKDHMLKKIIQEKSFRLILLGMQKCG